ncbi:hypothetical protein [Jannaschia sp. W003]|uniref:hypothetical protein n=1 Tax=Jannaschia sp. W003 TaxID=2867012 RepID=UPI0021A3CBF6|nr:hypothetical protein [Jannaschia sp. W003]UWQ22901.1 hypothetical protein K3554_07715 [Jannaschia sp. W003]
METLRYRFDLRGHDLHRTARRIAWREGGGAAFAAHAALFAAAAAAQWAWPRAEWLDWAPAGALAAGFALYPLAHRARLLAAARGPLLRGPARLRLDPEGYTWRGPAATSEGRWAAVARVVRARRHVAMRTGGGAPLAVSHGALSPLIPADAAHRIERWIAGARNGAPIERTDRLRARDLPGLLRALDRADRSGRADLAWGAALVALLVWAAVAERLDLAPLLAVAPVGVVIVALLGLERRSARLRADRARRSPAFRGTLQARFSDHGWSAEGDGWRIEGPWSRGVRLSAVGGALVLRLGPVFHLPIPAEALGEHAPKVVAEHVNRHARRARKR